MQNVMLFKIPEGTSLKNPVHWLALGFGTGCSLTMPGTIGTMAGVIIYYFAQALSVWLYLFLVIILFIVGIWICQTTARDMGKHDHPAIVWDEIVGYLIAMSMAPDGWQWILGGFLVFRFFDIAKPWPISQVDKSVTGGLGIMLDDAIAALFSLAILQIMVYML